MKTKLHPTDYRPVVFSDDAAKFAFLTQSTAQTNETIKWEDGIEYPLVKVHISSASHPFYTGEEKIVDIEGRVDRFKAHRAAADKKREALTNKARKTTGKNEASAKKSPVETAKIGTKPSQPKPKTAPEPKAKIETEVKTKVESKE